MEREGAARSLHRLVGEAVVRSAELQEESRAAVEQTRAATAALARTVEQLQRCRARRAFGNRHVDAQDPEGAG